MRRGRNRSVETRALVKGFDLGVKATVAVLKDVAIKAGLQNEWSAGTLFKWFEVLEDEPRHNKA